MRLGINGFGRIGRIFLKTLIERHPSVEVVAVNDITSPKELAHLFKYDSNYGPFEGDVKAVSDAIIVDGRTIKVLAERDPAKLPWKQLGAEVVIESTGLFTAAEKARAHIDAGGAKKVIISAPATGEDITLVLGVNDDRYDPEKHHIISNASCTTNCLATAAKPLYRTIPEVKGTFDGFALRVPTPTVSMVYLVAQVKRETTKDEVNALLKSAAEGPLKEYVLYTEEEIVSSDLKRSPYSSIIDAGLTNANGDLVQIGAWYDNEWGYSSRLADLAKIVLEKLPTRV